jgi:hypothetical protein
LEEVIKGFVDGDESVTGVDECSIWLACRAEVPIRAIKTLVANTVDILVTSITDGVVASVTTRSEKSMGDHVEWGILNSSLEGMLGVVTVLLSNVAWDAKVIVGA